MKHAQRKTGMDTFYGKYRAKVTKLYDDRECDKSGRGKENRGRIKVECPVVYGEYESPWCEPLWGYCFDRHGDFVMPEMDDYVYIEFEQGNTNLPIWCGAWVQKNHTPLTNDVAWDKEEDGCGWHDAPTPHVEAETLKENSGGEDEVYEDHHDAVRFVQYGKFWIAMHRNPPYDGEIGEDDWLRIYMEDPEDPKQELMEFFANEDKLWLKRKRGTMTFYSDDEETYLERGAGKFILYTNDDESYVRRDRVEGEPTPPSGEPEYHKTPYGGPEEGDGADFEMYTNDCCAYFHRKDSELHMRDADTRLWKGENLITMTTEDTTFDVPNDITFNIGNNATWNVGNNMYLEVVNNLAEKVGNSTAHTSGNVYSREAGSSISDEAPVISHN